ncbi:MAG: hypothetical protein ABW321_32635 [Polyangiales bacterium]
MSVLARGLLSVLGIAALALASPSSARAEPSSVVHRLELGTTARSSLPNAETLCLGAVLGYAVVRGGFGARARVGLCGSQFDQGQVRANIRAQDLDVRLYHGWTLGIVTLEVGLGGGAVWFNQEFTGAFSAPSRNTLAPFTALGTRVVLAMMRGFYAGADLAGETHFIRMQKDAASPMEQTASFALRASLALGKQF